MPHYMKVYKAARKQFRSPTSPPPPPPLLVGPVRAAFSYSQIPLVPRPQSRHAKETGTARKPRAQIMTRQKGGSTYD